MKRSPVIKSRQKDATCRTTFFSPKNESNGEPRESRPRRTCLIGRRAKQKPSFRRTCCDLVIEISIARNRNFEKLLM